MRSSAKLNLRGTFETFCYYGQETNGKGAEINFERREIPDPAGDCGASQYGVDTGTTKFTVRSLKRESRDLIFRFVMMEP